MPRFPPWTRPSLPALSADSTGDAGELCSVLLPLDLQSWYVLGVALQRAATTLDLTIGRRLRVALVVDEPAARPDLSIGDAYACVEYSLVLRVRRPDDERLNQPTQQGKKHRRKRTLACCAPAPVRTRRPSRGGYGADCILRICHGCRATPGRAIDDAAGGSMNEAKANMGAVSTRLWQNGRRCA